MRFHDHVGPFLFVLIRTPILYREEDELISGGVMTALIHPGDEGGKKPQKGDLVSDISKVVPRICSITRLFAVQVFLHVTIAHEKDDSILFSTRHEHGGTGEPWLYVLEKASARPLRGIEIAVLSMTAGERSMVVMKPSMCLLHRDVSQSSMAQAMKRNASLIDDTDVYKADVELIAWRSHTKVIEIDGNSNVFKEEVCDGEGWETPREPYTVTVVVTGRSVVSPFTVIYPESTITCDIGDGSLPKELEAGICAMRKGEESIIFCPAQTQHPMLQALDLPGTTLPEIQAPYVEFHVKLVDFLQARDLMGEGKTIKRIICKGTGEFPIDCPMEDTSVSIRTKIRKVGTSTWNPLLTQNEAEVLEISTGMGLLPIVLDTAVRLMLLHETSVLKTTFDDDLASHISSKSLELFEKGEEVEIEIELDGFKEAVPIEALSPEEKLQRATALKEMGNTLYKQDRVSLAKGKYDKALHCVGKSYEFSGDDSEAAFNLKISCMLNLAACCQKNSAFGEAIEWCERALRYGTKRLLFISIVVTMMIMTTTMFILAVSIQKAQRHIFEGQRQSNLCLFLKKL